MTLGFFQRQLWWRRRSPESALSPKFVQFIQLEFGLKVRNAHWYEQALTHASLGDQLKDGRRNNERLEFLGDSVLGAIAAELVFYSFPEDDEGPLTMKKSHLVSRKMLNQIGESMGLSRFIQSNFRDNVIPSSVVGNALEALIGAVYLDHGYEKAKSGIKESLIRHGALKSFDETQDFKSKLDHWARIEQKMLQYVLVEDQDDSGHPFFKVVVELDGEVCGTGSGRSKKAAEQQAAQHALQRGEWRTQSE